MTTNTMVAIQTITVTGSSAASVSFGTGLAGNIIPQTYTDLVLVANSTLTSGPTNVVVTVNGNTGSTNYSGTYVFGDGSSAASGRSSSGAGFNPTYASTTLNTTIYHFMNYSNSTTYKTILARSSTTDTNVLAYVGLWRGSTGSAVNQPITSITLTGGVNFAVGSTFTLYGIANADIGAYATGGVITQDANYYYHAFGNSSYFTPTRNLTADILVVAGGGAGGSNQAGGGGAGGLLYAASQSLTNGTSYTCSVGAGGAGVSSNAGSNGVNSYISGTSFTTLTAIGGGGGGNSGSGTTAGATGGSGGGGGGQGYAGGSPTSGQGNAGGTSASGGSGGGGGGGAGTSGGAGTTTYIAGNGGNGTSSYNSWLSTTGVGVLNSSDNLRYIAAGGGGGVYYTGTKGTGGIGGGGNGNTEDGPGANANGLSNTGSGGGGGGGHFSGAGGGGNGGSGLIIVRYAK